ncbi:MAG: HXXEE domain-containing protein [Ginsengibacter sp.]
MRILRKHWFDIGGVFALFILIALSINWRSASPYALIMWLSLASLFLHQVEEYRWPGTFPGMINTVLFKSNFPDHYPLNSNTALVINVGIGWLFYLLAAITGTNAVWLGLATILVSAGNVIAHTILFNRKGRTLYNAGMLTACIFFAPCIYYFFYVVYHDHLITVIDYLIGLPLGVVLNVVGVLKMIDWLKVKDSPYLFEPRNLLSGKEQSE